MNARLQATNNHRFAIFQWLALTTYLVLGKAVVLDELEGVPAGEVQADGADGEGGDPLVCFRADVLEEGHEVHLHIRG